jgi:hypothetical protein
MRDVSGNNSEELDCYRRHDTFVEGHDCAKLLTKEKRTIGANAVEESGSLPLM